MVQQCEPNLVLRSDLSLLSAFVGRERAAPFNNVLMLGQNSHQVMDALVQDIGNLFTKCGQELNFDPWKVQPDDYTCGP